MRLWPWIIGGVGVGTAVWWFNRPVYRVVVVQRDGPRMVIIHQETTRSREGAVQRAMEIARTLEDVDESGKGVYVTSGGTVVALFANEKGTVVPGDSDDVRLMQAGIEFFNAGIDAFKSDDLPLPLSGAR